MKSGINRGSVIATSVTSNGRLVIDPQYNLEPTLQTITVKPSLHLGREVIGKYLLGYDVIRVEARDRITMEQRKIIKETSSRLIGLEIIEEDSAKIVMQCLLEPSALPPKKILRREHLIASGMYRDAVKALIEGDIQLAKNVIARDNEADRLYFLLVRILRTVIQNPGLSEKLEVRPIDCLDHRLTASLVESVGDQSSQIAEYAVRLDGAKPNGEVSRALSKLSEVVYESYTDAVAAFLSHNISIADSVRSRRDEVEEIYGRVESACNTLPIEIAQNLVSMISLISRVYDHSVDISDLTTPRTI
ncbi:MAG: phosphate uptake regulator PhoU [Candidatus Bathyarchaeota archaeon]|nr:phosphate uptake regulator PhoU [Candidatus Bathyarchaeota archaeon]